jgi:hypothetical protein
VQRPCPGTCAGALSGHRSGQRMKAGALFMQAALYSAPAQAPSAGTAGNCMLRIQKQKHLVWCIEGNCCLLQAASLSAPSHAPALAPAAGTAGNSTQPRISDGGGSGGTTGSGVAFSNGRRLLSSGGDLPASASLLERLSEALQDMGTSEVERNAALAILHADRLAAHGYRQVRPCHEAWP